MKDDPRPFASLSSTLLARRGGARPAMRPQAIQLAGGVHNPLEDLGWNDMGEMSSAEIATPATPVAAQQAELQRHFALETIEAARPAARAAPGSKAKSAFTLRLDAERHLKLRLLCAVDHRSAQQIVTQALDEFLARHHDRISLPGSVPGNDSNPNRGDKQ